MDRRRADREVKITESDKLAGNTAWQAAERGHVILWLESILRDTRADEESKRIAKDMLEHYAKIT